MQTAPLAEFGPNQTGDSPSLTPHNRALLFTVLALAAGIAATFWFERVRYERLTGSLQARLRPVAAPRDARISELLVPSGAAATAGQPLIKLKDASIDERLEAKQRQIESLEIELAQSQARLDVELEWRRNNILELIFEAKLKCFRAVRQESAPSREFNASRDGGWATSSARTISKKHPLLERTIERTNGEPEEGDSVDVTDSEVRLCLDHIQELERMNRELPEKLSRSMGVDLVQSRLAHAKAELARLEGQKRDLTLVAESSGVVGVFQKQAGDYVSTHETIVQLLDEEQPFLLLPVASSRISNFSPGTTVELRFPGGQKGKGRVDEIPPQTSAAAGENRTVGETAITVHVVPVGPLWPNLPFGSEVEVYRKR
jgi:multidrug resistance efflux pump